ncbi:MAG TPA: hypothetical protein VFR84_12365 [Candidatus Angelobacter sp.]|nr:hypothetical protein [Candidatus Angelobacter sp.]
MENWLTKAQNSFPELQGFLFEQHFHDTPMALWIDLFDLLQMAYAQQPANDDLIGRIYDYAAWCFAQPDADDVENDLSDATAVGFIESIPLAKKACEDLYRWMSIESFEGFKNLFRYHLSEEQYEVFREDFLRKKNTYSGPSRLSMSFPAGNFSACAEPFTIGFPRACRRSECENRWAASTYFPSTSPTRSPRAKSWSARLRC